MDYKLVTIQLNQGVFVTVDCLWFPEGQDIILYDIEIFQLIWSQPDLFWGTPLDASQLLL